MAKLSPESLEKKRAYNREYAKKKRAERKSKALCPDCGNPKNSQKYRCSACELKNNNLNKTPEGKEKINARGKERRLERKVKGSCYLCCNPAVEGYARCQKHLDELAARRKEKKEKYQCYFCSLPSLPGLSVCQEHKNTRDADNVCRKEERSVCVENGICSVCCTEPADRGKKSCFECRSAKTNFSRKLSAKRVEAGLCASCGLPAFQESKKCLQCYLKKTAMEHGLGSSYWEELHAILKKQNGLCAYSGVELIIGKNCSIDHIVPLSAGGSQAIDNVHWVDLKVNMMKRDMYEQDFLHYIELIYNKTISGGKNGR